MERSRLDWSGNMQVIRKGGSEIAMTEGELARFFGVTWKKLNGKLQVIQKSSNLHLDEMCAGEKAMVRDNELTGYALSAPGNHRPRLSAGQHGSSFVQKVCLP